MKRASLHIVLWWFCCMWTQRDSKIVRKTLSHIHFSVWQEPICQQTFQSWITEMSAYVKSLDGTHLVSFAPHILLNSLFDTRLHRFVAFKMTQTFKLELLKQVTEYRLDEVGIQGCWEFHYYRCFITIVLTINTYGTHDYWPTNDGFDWNELVLST